MYNRFIQIAPGLPRKYAENTVIFSKTSGVFARNDSGFIMLKKTVQRLEFDHGIRT